MTEPTSPEPHGEADEVSGRGVRPGVPRWVTAFAIVMLVLVLLVVVLLLTGEGHGPSRHVPPTGIEHSLPQVAAALGGLLR